jgi:hypothetical protein
MDHRCYRCGAEVEPGVPFCPNCRAPQIRVGEGDDSEPATPPMPPGTPGEVQPPAERLDLHHRSAEPPPRPPIIIVRQAPRIDWRPGLGAAAIGGLVLLFSMGLHPIIVVPVWVLAGMVSVWMYRRWRPHAILTPGLGARLGALTGAIGGIYASVFFGISAAFSGGQLRHQLYEQLQQTAARSSNPEAQQMIQRFMTPEGFVLMIVFIIIFLFAFYIFFATVGGAAAIWLRPKETGR